MTGYPSLGRAIIVLRSRRAVADGTKAAGKSEAAIVTLAGIPGSAESTPTCSTEGIYTADWVVIKNTGEDSVCVKPGVRWGKYARIQLEPSSFGSTDSAQPLKPDDVKKLTAFFDAKLKSSFVTHVLGTMCYLCLRSGQMGIWLLIPDSNLRPFD
jgi:hypothetical protein